MERLDNINIRIDGVTQKVEVVSEELADIEDIVESKNYKVTRDTMKKLMCLYDWLQVLEYRMTYLSHDVTTEIEIPERPTGAIPSVIELEANRISSTQDKDA